MIPTKTTQAMYEAQILCRCNSSATKNSLNYLKQHLREVETKAIKVDL